MKTYVKKTNFIWQEIKFYTPMAPIRDKIDAPIGFLCL